MQEVAPPEYYNFTTINDMTPVIVKLKQLNPDVVHHIAFSNDAPLFWRQAREQNFQFKALVHAGATGYGGRTSARPSATTATACSRCWSRVRASSIETAQARRAADREGVPRCRAEARPASYPFGAHQLAGGGLWLLKLVLDACARATIPTSSARPSWRSTCRSGR